MSGAGWGVMWGRLRDVFCSVVWACVEECVFVWVPYNGSMFFLVTVYCGGVFGDALGNIENAIRDAQVHSSEFP